MNETSAGYEKLLQAEKTLGIARAGLDKLASMGENLSMEDLVSEAGKIVAAGVSPGAMANMLADAPQDNSQLLAEWVKRQDMELTQREQQLKLALSVQRQRMGVEGMKMVTQAQGAGNPLMSGAPAPTDNALMGGGSAPAGGLNG